MTLEKIVSSLVVGASIGVFIGLILAVVALWLWMRSQRDQCPTCNKKMKVQVALGEGHTPLGRWVAWCPKCKESSRGKTAQMARLRFLDQLPNEGSK